MHLKTGPLADHLAVIEQEIVQVGVILGVESCQCPAHQFV